MVWAISEGTCNIVVEFGFKNEECKKDETPCGVKRKMEKWLYFRPICLHKMPLLEYSNIL